MAHDHDVVATLTRRPHNPERECWDAAKQARVAHLGTAILQISAGLERIRSGVAKLGAFHDKIKDPAVKGEVERDIAALRLLDNSLNKARERIRTLKER